MQKEQKVMMRERGGGGWRVDCSVSNTQGKQNSEISKLPASSSGIGFPCEMAGTRGRGGSK